MQARLTAHLPDSAAVDRLLEPDARLRIGRGADCDLQLPHASVSRAHAELVATDDGWQLTDLGSKNGVWVDDARIIDVHLQGPCWLRFGDVYCEFAPLDETTYAAQQRRHQERRNTAMSHTARLSGIRDFGDLLEASLRGVIELSQCSRGFVLLDDEGRFDVRASIALDSKVMAGREFSGSVGAVARALQEKNSVVVNDIGAEAWLASRASVIAGGLRTLLCLPLLDDQRVLGAIYADRREIGEPITTLDLELLEAYADRAALWIAARRASDSLTARAASVEWNSIVAAHAPEAR